MTNLANSDLHVHKHILSVDVEDYFQVEAFRDVIGRDTWDQWPSRVDANTRRVLDLFDEYDAKGTFFFVGWVADRNPGLVREVQRRGHELACHSYWHRTVYSLSPKEFADDTRRACDAIEQAAGVRVVGYRAPSWSITRDSIWALDVLAEQSFMYDSSIYPIRHDIYGIPGASRFAYQHACGNGRQLPEFPPTTVKIGSMQLPAAGGGYLRIFPLRYTRWAMSQVEREEQPAIVYFHPWEVDPEQPRVAAKLRSRFRHYTNLRMMMDRLRFLLKSYRFQPFAELLAHSSYRTLPVDAEERNA
jgi:polysaccharide deacetylase family protein (PEP-CTERM system associated)